MAERESWKQQYYRKPIVDHKLHLNKQCAAKVMALCSNPIYKHTSCQHPQPLYLLVSAQAEVGNRKAKLKRRKDTNLLLRHSAPLSGITLWQHMWVQTLLHGHLPPLLPPHRARKKVDSKCPTSKHLPEDKEEEELQELPPSYQMTARNWDNSQEWRLGFLFSTCGRDSRWGRRGILVLQELKERVYGGVNAVKYKFCEAEEKLAKKS